MTNKSITPQETSLIDEINILPSEIIEDALLQIGEILANALLETTRYDETVVLDELSSVFCYVTSTYGEQTGKIREDLGVSLSEATLMKIEAFRKNNLESPIDNDWYHFAKDAQKIIGGEKEKQEREKFIKVLREFSDILTHNPEKTAEITYRITGLMATDYARRLPNDDPIDEILTIAGELELMPEDSDKLREELITKINALRLRL